MSDPSWRKRIMDQLVGPRTKHPVDLASRQQPDHDPSQPTDPNRLSVTTPPDVPAYVSLVRLMQRTKDDNTSEGGKRSSTAMVGSTMVLDYFSYGVKVYVRHGLLDGTLKVIIEDSEGRETVAEYERGDN